MAFVLVTGGVRSGKSRYAEERVATVERVLYVATGMAWDDEMRERIARHAERRPGHWGLLEAEGELVAPLMEALESGRWDGVLVDCLSTWVSRVLMDLPEEEWRSESTRRRVLLEAGLLADVLSGSEKRSVVVTSETGLGGVAMSPLGRAFQDLLGEVNQVLAGQAEEMVLLVSGRPMRLSN